MTYCIDFFRKFKKEGNFCGLDKSEVSRLNAYLDIVELLMKQKIPEETVYENFPVNAARPLISAKDKARTEGLNFVTTQLKEGKKVKTGDLQDSLKSWTCPTRENARPKKVGDLQLPRREETEKSKENITPAREHAFTPLHDGEPVDPPKTLTEIAAAPPAAFTKVSEPAPVPETLPCQEEPRKPCPDGQVHIRKDIRGPCCDKANMPIKGLGYCHIIEMRKRQVLDDGLGNKIIKPGGIRIVKTPLTCEELNKCADDIIERSGTFTEREVPLVDELIKVRYEGIRTRADFVKKACNWFLTKAGEE